MKQKILNVAIAYIIFFFFSCTENGTTNNNITKNITDTVITDIPFNNRLNLFISAKHNVEIYLGIEKLEEGFRDLEIRIWSYESFNDTDRLVVLKNNSSNWNAEIYHFPNRIYNRIDSVISNRSKSIKKEPISGWDNFIGKLKELHILTLQDYSKIPGYYLPTDGDGVFIEVATKNKYRIYSYPSPDLYSKKIAEAREILKIIKLVNAEFLLRDKW